MLTKRSKKSLYILIWTNLIYIWSGQVWWIRWMGDYWRQSQHWSFSWMPNNSYPELSVLQEWRENAEELVLASAKILSDTQHGSNCRVKMCTYVRNTYISNQEKNLGNKILSWQLDIWSRFSVKFRCLNPITQLTKPLLNLLGISKAKDSWNFTRKLLGADCLTPDLFWSNRSSISILTSSSLHGGAKASASCF